MRVKRRKREVGEKRTGGEGGERGNKKEYKIMKMEEIKKF
jgi:hypothetical protein